MDSLSRASMMGASCMGASGFRFEEVENDCGYQSSRMTLSAFYLGNYGAVVCRSYRISSFKSRDQF